MLTHPENMLRYSQDKVAELQDEAARWRLGDQVKQDSEPAEAAAPKAEPSARTLPSRWPTWLPAPLRAP